MQPLPLNRLLMLQMGYAFVGIMYNVGSRYLSGQQLLWWCFLWPGQVWSKNGKSFACHYTPGIFAGFFISACEPLRAGFRRG